MILYISSDKLTCYSICLIILIILKQDWIREMATHVKYIDGNHLLEIGLEGFYGESRKQNNPGNQVVGTDFISNNQIPGIDFATIHLYPEQW